jgi:hypothetical protein
MPNQTMQTLIYQHVPKAAGSTLHTLVYNNVDRARVYTCGENGVLQDFLALDRAERDRFAVLIGHVDYGIHERFGHPCRYFTFLREPVDRTVSHYHFIRNTPSHRYHAQARAMDLTGFIESGIRPRMNNCMARMLSGFVDVPYNQCPPEMLDAALEHVRAHYAFVGFVETFAHSLAGLVRALGWGSSAYTVRNVSRSRPRVDQLTRAERACVERHNALDTRLYAELRRLHG